MPKYIARTSHCYWLEIEAENEEATRQIAEATDINEWHDNEWDGIDLEEEEA